MKAKRWISMGLSVLLLCSAMAAPAEAEGAEETEETEGIEETEESGRAARLTEVTGKVKKTLGLDTEAYSNFQGELEEGALAPMWYLYWNGDGGSLDVTATEEGKVIRYYRYDADASWDRAALTLPKGDPVRAKNTAEAFLKRVLSDGETVVLDDTGSNALPQESYSYRGTILLNGLPSPISYSIRVRTSDYTVTSFYRDNPETSYMGDIPSAKFHTSEEKAKDLLRTTLDLRLEYVLDGTTAYLRYLPNERDNYYVDDVSGKLVDLTKEYAELDKNGTVFGTAEAPADTVAMSEAADSGTAYQLTEAEQVGAEKLKGTLSKEALEKKARAITELGLKAYTLNNVSYREKDTSDDETAMIVAQVSFVRKADEGIYRRTVILDAKTGDLQRVYSSIPWQEDFHPQVDREAAQKTAEDFLAKYRAENYALCAAYESSPTLQWYTEDSQEIGFVYARKENGYFFPDSQYVVEIDTADGSVSSFDETWVEDVQFDSTNGLIAADKAVDAYLGTFTVEGGYVAVPEALDLSDPKYAELADMGYGYLHALKLGYQLKSGDDLVVGIDAKTGEPVVMESGEDSITYSDLADAGEAKTAIETLASYGIGYDGGVFQPQKALTQRDMVILLASTQGYCINPDVMDDEEADNAYQAVYSMGAMKREERDDTKTLSRVEVLKLLLDAGGYGSVAKIQDIYRTSFTDQADISADMLGYAAIAQGMGVVSSAELAPNRGATRAEAAMMLCAFMKRSVR